jgi:hypothetical protein
MHRTITAAVRLERPIWPRGVCRKRIGRIPTPTYRQAGTVPPSMACDAQ